MSAKVDLYNSAYSNYAAEAYRQIRLETYGEDLGQTGWTTNEESKEIPRMLGLAADCRVLEIGCGSGRYLLQVAGILPCHGIGIDINPSGIENARKLAEQHNLSTQIRFDVCDASKSLPFDDSSFDAVFANDVLCHIPGRSELLAEIYRVLRAGGRLLFSDALIVAAIVSHEEISRRSAIGYYLFSPPGENERLLEHQGFRLLAVTDTTENAAALAQRWHDARQRRRQALLNIEGEINFEQLQQFLSTVHLLTREGRLRRYLYVAEKPGAAHLSD